MAVFTVPGDPVSVNAMYGHRGRPWLTQAARNWRDAVGLFARAGHTKAFSGPVEVHIVYYHVAEGRFLDVDNLVKLILDGMAGILYQNDRQVRRLIVERRHDPLEPRVEVYVRCLPEALQDRDR